MKQSAAVSRFGEEGYTLLLVLVAIGFISSFSVLVVYYGQWQAQVQSIEENLVKLNQAEKFASGWTRENLKESLSDSSVLEPVDREWNLEPGITVRVHVESLNDKINLNELGGQKTSRTFVEMVDSLLTDMNYPDRTTKELVRWMTPEENRPGGGSGQYAGYGYTAPGRDIRHLDEVRLISGFRDIGLSDEFRKMFTVYGTGNINPLHFTPEQWQKFTRSLGGDVPTIPSAALQNRQTLQQYLKQDPIWEELSGSYDFFVREDDSFLATYYLEREKVVRRAREVLVYDGEQETIDRRTRFTISPSDISRVSSGEDGRGVD
jgi:hypothetical protein